MKKVVITGADGFIGKHLIEHLLNYNIEVWAMVRRGKKKHIINHENYHCIQCDYAEPEAYIDLFPTDIDAMYHMAWQGVNALERDDLTIQLRNIDIGLNVIKFAKKIKVKRIIFPGSTNEYLYYGKPIDEKAFPSPQNAYGTVKIAFRHIAEYYTCALGMSYNYVVISSIYSADRRDNNVIYYTIDKLLNNEKPSLTKLEQLWDYIHIDDVVEALRLIGERGIPNHFYCVGCGDNKPLYDYINTIRNYINPALPLGVGEIPYVSSILPSSCVSIETLQRDTGFAPSISFEKGIQEVITTIQKEKQF